MLQKTEGRYQKLKEKSMTDINDSTIEAWSQAEMEKRTTVNIQKQQYNAKNKTRVENTKNS